MRASPADRQPCAAPRPGCASGLGPPSVSPATLTHTHGPTQAAATGAATIIRSQAHDFEDRTPLARSRSPNERSSSFVCRPTRGRGPRRSRSRGPRPTRTLCPLHAPHPQDREQRHVHAAAAARLAPLSIGFRPQRLQTTAAVAAHGLQLRPPLTHSLIRMLMPLAGSGAGSAAPRVSTRGALPSHRRLDRSVVCDRSVVRHAPARRPPWSSPH